MHGIDRTLLTLTIIFVVAGFFIFASASLGLLARDGATFSSVALNQILFGVVAGGFAMFLTSMIHYRFWRQYAFYLFVISLILTLLVFVPHIGFAHGGAHRWITIGSLSFQPAEALKVTFIIYIATWLSGMKQHLNSFIRGTLPFIGFVVGVGILMLAQPDTDTFLIITTAAFAMFITAGGRIRDVALMIIASVLLVAFLAMVRPYVKNRIETFIDPTRDQQGTGYQVHQSLIAIGSGSVFGRGFGQSIQKFGYLPEPIGDSIFAVFGEEFGFIGSLILVLLFMGFTLRSYRVATHAPDLFSMLLVVGFATTIFSQAFLNIGAMLAIMPLSGIPLPFISHGGTALFFLLASVGIMLNVSKYQKLSA